MMAGRGRGRGRGALNYDAIGKPVGIASSPTEDELAELINTLNVNAASVNAVTLSAAKNMKSDEAIENIVKLMVERCNKDWAFAKQAAKICQQLGSCQGGTYLKKYLLRTMQSSFKEKKNLRDASQAKFLGAMSLFCQTFAIVRSEEGKLFSALINPVVEVLELMLDDSATDEEMACSIQQMRAIMPVVYECDSSYRQKYNDLLSLLRSDIINCRGSRDLRENMLAAIEENARLASIQKP